MTNTIKHHISIEGEIKVPGKRGITKLIRRCIAATLASQGICTPCEINVLLTDDETIHALNLEHRNVDRPTDVLSFPMFSLVPGDFSPHDLTDPESGRIPLGDIALSLERASAQAVEYGHSVAREAGYLTVHSVLHLLGYDHMDDGPEAKAMREAEEAVLSPLGLLRDGS